MISDEQFLDNLRGSAHAFPFEVDAPDGKASYFCSGMTLRDYFAARAMEALIAKVVLRDQDTGMPAPVVTEVQQKIATGAYAYADAMIRARGQR